MVLKFTAPEITINLDLITTEIMQVCFEQLNLINKEISQSRRSGKASDGSAFRDYSESYKEAIRAGQVKYKAAETPVNLLQTGQFNRSFVVSRVNKNSVGIRIKGDRNRDLFMWLEEKGFSPIMTLSPKNQARIEKAVSKVIKDNLSKIIIIKP